MAYKKPLYPDICARQENGFLKGARLFFSSSWAKQKKRHPERNEGSLVYTFAKEPGSFSVILSEAKDLVTLSSEKILRRYRSSEWQAD